MFAKTWPERSRRLFSCFDPVIQRVSASICLVEGFCTTGALSFPRTIYIGNLTSQIRSFSLSCMFVQLINDEDGGMHRRHASPALRERSSQISTNPQISVSSTLAGYGTSAIVAMDRKASVNSGPSFSSGLFSSQASVGKSTERSLESVLNASKQKVTAIESMLRGLDISEKGRSVSLDLGISFDLLTFLSSCYLYFCQ